MKIGSIGGFVLGIALSCGSMVAQVATAQPGRQAVATPGTPSVHHPRRRHRAVPGVQVIPRESQGASAPSPVDTAAQRTADQRLLQQQQAQSTQAAALQNQVVQQAVRQQQQVQQEVRIQDAPGPAQTGVVPAAGSPVAPVSSNDRIQDAPGPAQTLPQPATPALQPTAPQH